MLFFLSDGIAFKKTGVAVKKTDNIIVTVYGP